MEPAPVSVVIPTYNSAAVVCEAIESVLGQSLPPAELIVIDDGSSDDTAERIRRFGDRVRYQRQSNAGPSEARNHGMRLATKPFVAFLDADDVWHPRKLELQMWHLWQHPELGVIATDHIDWPHEAFVMIEPGNFGTVVPVTWEQLVIRATILTSSVIVRRPLLDRAGPFDGELCGSEDRDLFLRLADITEVGRLELGLIGYRDSPNSLTKDAATCERGMRLILKRLDDRRAWRGRWLLRQKYLSFVDHSCASARARASDHWGAVYRELRSLAHYPLPYAPTDVRMRFERVKRLGVNGLRMLHLKPPDAHKRIADDARLQQRRTAGATAR